MSPESQPCLVCGDASRDNAEMAGFTCRTCGEQHPEPPRIWGSDAPAPYYDLAPAQRGQAALNSDQCIIETPSEIHFFVRGRLEIPVVDDDEPFAWLVWVSLSEASFERTSALWERKGREAEPPYFGWLSDRLPYPEPTLFLKTRVHTRPVGQRPFIELEPTDHPLAREQQEGMTRARLLEIAEHFMHPNGSAP